MNDNYHWQHNIRLAKQYVTIIYAIFSVNSLEFSYEIWHYDDYILKRIIIVDCAMGLACTANSIEIKLYDCSFRRIVCISGVPWNHEALDFNGAPRYTFTNANGLMSKAC